MVLQRFDAQARVLNRAAASTIGLFVGMIRVGPGNPPGFHDDHVDQIGQEFIPQSPGPEPGQKRRRNFSPDHAGGRLFDDRAAADRQNFQDHLWRQVSNGSVWQAWFGSLIKLWQYYILSCNAL
jgi:hypothetical protein